MCIMAQAVSEITSRTSSNHQQNLKFDWDALTKVWKVDNKTKQVTKTTGHILFIVWQAIFIEA